MINPWQTLGVHRHSTPDEIKIAFHQLAWDLHPDRGGDSRQFQAINEAWAVLKDRRHTAAFISAMTMHGRMCGACKGAGATFKSKGFTKCWLGCKECGGAGVLLRKVEQPTISLAAVRKGKKK